MTDVWVSHESVTADNLDQAKEGMLLKIRRKEPLVCEADKGVLNQQVQLGLNSIPICEIATLALFRRFRCQTSATCVIRLL